MTAKRQGWRISYEIFRPGIVQTNNRETSSFVWLDEGGCLLPIEALAPSSKVSPAITVKCGGLTLMVTRMGDGQRFLTVK